MGHLPGERAMKIYLRTDASPGIEIKGRPPDLKAAQAKTTRTFVTPSEPSEPSGNHDGNKPWSGFVVKKPRAHEPAECEKPIL